MFNDEDKAGLSGLDKVGACSEDITWFQASINAVIEQHTNVDFEQHNQKQRLRIADRVSRNDRVLAETGPDRLLEAEREMDTLASELESERSLDRFIVHLDLDAFYASVEMRDNPTLRSLPLAVGSDSMLSTSNYAARRFGVRSAMPGFLAKRLCPELCIVPCNFDKYRRVSDEVRQLLVEYDPNVSMAGLDEAYLDLTELVVSRVPKEWKRQRFDGSCLCRLPRVEDDDTSHGPVTLTEEHCEYCLHRKIIWSDQLEFGCSVDDVVEELRFRIRQLTGLTCSAGIACNTRLAKICSNLNKPNGQYRLASENTAIIAFMQTLPIRKVNGIGRVTEAVLEALEVKTCGDLWQRRAILPLLFSSLSCRHFLRIALGLGRDRLDGEEHFRKSIGVERTFAARSDFGELLEITQRLCAELIGSLPDYALVGGRCVTVKIKYASFDVITRSAPIKDEVVKDEDRLCELVEAVLRRECQKEASQRVRLLGVRLSRLVFEDEQVVQDQALPTIWSSETPRCPICNRVLDASDDRMVNDHIDQCLNRKAIQEMNKEERKRHSPKPPKAPTSAKKTKSSPNKTKSSPDPKQASINRYFHPK